MRHYYFPSSHRSPRPKSYEGGATISSQPALSHLFANEALAAQLERTQRSIAAVHRRPVNLRRVEITAGESAVRGARCATLIEPSISLEHAVSVYSLLAPDVVESSARTFLRAPLQVLARADALMGGPGRPASNGAALLQLAQLIAAQPHAAAIPGVVHGVIAGGQCFGERSGTVGRMAARLAAIASGFDPRGLTVPEPFCHRHQARYREVLDAMSQALGEGWDGPAAGVNGGVPTGVSGGSAVAGVSGAAAVEAMVQFQLEAFEAGAREAEGIARAASAPGGHGRHG